MSMFKAMTALPNRAGRSVCLSAVLTAALVGPAPIASADDHATRSIHPAVQREFAAAQAPVKADLPTMRVVLRPSRMVNRARNPQAAPTGPVNRGPGCTQFVASRTSANFTGGSFVAQAGFGEMEIAAASYLLAATVFPIKFDLAEIILVTSNATVSTTTQWSILVWDGEPSTGQLVAEYSSDGLILPHAVLPPGTAGVNIQVSVDPGDPEQIFIFDNLGTHKFSIGFRIDQHNNQTQNPCLVAPPSNSNAFPCTDTGGLNFPADNWLFGLNCGAFGCPANGGWTRFSTLPGFCRPSGDWVMRATWESVNCAPASGACCNTGACGINAASLCASGGGTYQGDGTVCTPNPCPQPTGACCFTGGTCQTRTQDSCAGFGGTYAGNNVACGAGGVCPTGACCLGNGMCVAAQLATQCAGQGGTLQAVGSTCSPNPCPQPTGACCFTATGFCSPETQANCNIPGAVWRGAGTVCSAATCPNTGACCATNGFCGEETAANCNGIPGATFRGIGTVCNPDPCTASGACCCGTTCSVTQAGACSGANNFYSGNNTTCNPSGNNVAPCCRADYNHAGGISVQDIFDFLTGYFGTNPCANINGSGGISVQDIFDFLSAYFAGGC